MFSREMKGGVEETMMVNHFGPFLLTNLLLPVLHENSGRIVTLTSCTHRVRIHIERVNTGRISYVNKTL